MSFKPIFVLFFLLQTSPAFSQVEVSEVLFETFRGNAARNSVGFGALPENPSIQWRYPENKPMCGDTKVGGKVVNWCGSGWTGQPLAYKNVLGDNIVAFGAYDHGIHFLNAETGEQRYPTFFTKDIIKGTGTVHKDDLFSIGSRDNKLRVLRLTTDKVEELWSFDGNVKGGVWNNDWDGSPLLFEDYLIAGGENSWLFIFKLNKKKVNGQITVSPEEVVRLPGFDKELLNLAGNRNVSIENSVVLFEDRIYFANSGGMIWGYNFRKLIANPNNIKDALVFKFWAGDDIDATMTVDDTGMLYAGVELEKVSKKYAKARARSKKVGQVIKLNPYNWDKSDTSGLSLAPLEWSVHMSIDKKIDSKAGVWASPIISQGRLYVTSHTGLLYAIDIYSGEVIWTDNIGYHAWASPVITDDENNLLVASCQGELRNYSLVGDTPTLDWEFVIPGRPCIESTPLVLEGSIYVGTRDGYFYSIGEK